MIGISACLGGIYCRYDGAHNTVTTLQKLLETGEAIPVCPEVLGGLSTPRTPSEIVGGDGFAVWQNKAIVQTIDGKDVTEAFKLGAIKAYEKLKEAQVTLLVMKESSPSCGRNMVYDGTFSGVKKQGVGVATAYFLNQGLKVVSEKQWTGSVPYGD